MSALQAGSLGGGPDPPAQRAPIAQSGSRRLSWTISEFDNLLPSLRVAPSTSDAAVILVPALHRFQLSSLVQLYHKGLQAQQHCPWRVQSGAGGSTRTRTGVTSRIVGHTEVIAKNGALSHQQFPSGCGHAL